MKISADEQDLLPVRPVFDKLRGRFFPKRECSSGDWNITREKVTGKNPVKILRHLSLRIDMARLGDCKLKLSGSEEMKDELEERTT